MCVGVGYLDYLSTDNSQCTISICIVYMRMIDKGYKVVLSKTSRIKEYIYTYLAYSGIVSCSASGAIQPLEHTHSSA